MNELSHHIPCNNSKIIETIENKNPKNIIWGRVIPLFLAPLMMVICATLEVCKHTDLCTFVFSAIDAEFTGLTLNESQRPSLFDAPCDRYRKLKQVVGHFLVSQFGWCDCGYIILCGLHTLSNFVSFMQL